MVPALKTLKFILIITKCWSVSLGVLACSDTQRMKKGPLKEEEGTVTGRHQQEGIADLGFLASRDFDVGQA